VFCTAHHFFAWALGGGGSCCPPSNDAPDYKKLTSTVWNSLFGCRIYENVGPAVLTRLKDSFVFAPRSLHSIGFTVFALYIYLLARLPTVDIQLKLSYIFIRYGIVVLTSH